MATRKKRPVLYEMFRPRARSTPGGLQAQLPRSIPPSSPAPADTGADYTESRTTEPPTASGSTGEQRISLSMPTIAVLLALAVSVLAWGLHGHQAVVRRFGMTLMILTGLQVVLGVAALIVTRTWTGPRPPAVDVIVTTAHQAVGAALLALAAGLTLWFYRLLSPVQTTT